MKRILMQVLVILASLILIVSLILVNPVSAGNIENMQISGIFNIKNKASGKYLNVNLAQDANGTNVIQWTSDGSKEQKWRIDYTLGSDGYDYRLYAMCSSNGYNRVLDVLRTGGSSSGAITSGCNVDIWTPGDADAQDWYFEGRGDGWVYIRLRSNPNLVLTSYGTSNGSGAGKNSTSPGNVFVSTYTGSDNQLWSLIEL